jgi:S-layer family protein
MVKIVVNSFSVPLVTPATPTFQDVPPAHPFYRAIEAAAAAGIVSGYTCGAAGEPCPGAYFRPNNDVTRGQLSKIIVNTAGWATINPPVAHFRDVPVGSVFYPFVETAVCRGLVSGYDCGPGCYEFRPVNNATRGQIAKITYNAITSGQACATPAALTR